MHALKLIALFCIFCLAGLPAQAKPGRVAEVVDGDTLIVEWHNGESGRVRLFGIDCPEAIYAGRWEAQPFSRMAAEFVQTAVAEGSCEVAVFQINESYGRVVGVVTLLTTGRTLQEDLLRAGLAWVDTRYCKNSIYECRDWLLLQEEAAQEKRGLWHDPDPIPPWSWRGRTD